MLKAHKFWSIFLSIFILLTGQKIYSKTLGQEIKSSQTITSSGFYFLSQNINGFINIESDDVTLDLNCFKIFDTTSTGITITIGSGRQNVKIKNGSVVSTGANSSSSGILIENGVNFVTISDIIAEVP